MDATTLLADRVNGSKRTSVLKTDDETVSIRGRFFEDEDRSVLQIRAWVDALGYYLHAYFDGETGALIISTTGTQDGDAYERAAGELKRRGYDLKA